ncbi:beta-ketoacyl-[acyl-carrier-protein] synthase family protein ['Paenibacillus yunnanensis' Narsing Rao et al. 2020]|uniref:beta-ketoacyl-[acyl-carrier-protein] synthase family protein n=1 Tax=Paenibacillus tengchongensis TaxID=2608684 RepID=UPI001651DFD7|nr:beta-ketoacyl synthase N-terminal-like domain-containing protein [Paenibacillus tengchongensis]
MKKRVAVTGFGIKVPGGENNTDFQHHLISGDYHFVTRSELSPYGEPLLFGEINGGLGELDGREYRVLPRIAKLAILTVSEAIEHAKLPVTDLADRTGVFFGTTMGGITSLEDILGIIGKDDFRRLPVYCCGLVHNHTLASAVSSHFGLTGRTKTVTTGCTAGIEAMEDAIMYLQNGVIDTAIVGASDSSNNKATVFGFGKIKGLPFDQGPEAAGAPFSKHSKGFILSEGAATLILETEEHALARHAEIYGYIDKVASNNDGVSVNGQDLSGQRMKQAASAVLDGRIPDYYNSQALGYEANDRIEDIVSRDLFGHGVPLTSIKGLIGHPFSVSGLAQIIASMLGFRASFIPRTIRTDQYGYEHLPLITGPVPLKNKEVLITSHGYGGNNACVYLMKE